MVYIYVLLLKGDTKGKSKYYIGKTTNPKFRLEKHFSGEGSVWTKKYPPIKVVEFVADCDDYDEDKYTLKYMDKYGIDNVRGGSFTSIDLSDSDIEIIRKMNSSAGGKCFKCGKFGHFAKDCIATDENVEKEICFCFRCGRDGHEEDGCFALTDVDGRPLDEDKEFNKLIGLDNFDDDEFEYEYETKPKKVQVENYIKKKKKEKVCFRCGRQGHFKKDCYATKHVDGSSLVEEEDNYYDDDVCFRCGRKGHYSNACFAKIHVDGYYINN
jgi:hypothetical protein